ncbi:MAG: hypothetical protein ACSLFB_08220 [Acidimicrobiales bacterium]
MTIRKGEDWGELRPLPSHGVIVRTDGAAAAIATEARRLKQPIPPIGLLGGDLCRTLGGSDDPSRLRSSHAVTFPCDLGVAVLDGERFYFVAHIVARRQWWRGKAILAMNAAWLGGWNAGPKAHPGDALIDLYEADIPISQRVKVRARLPLGAHLPHPAIRGRRANTHDLTLKQPLPVYLDGQRLGTFSHIELSLEPDALTIVI